MSDLIRREAVNNIDIKKILLTKTCALQCIEKEINAIPSVNAIEIPKSSTNGDMIKAMFPNCTTIVEIDRKGNAVVIWMKIGDEETCFTPDWWYAP